MSKITRICICSLFSRESLISPDEEVFSLVTISSIFGEDLYAAPAYVVEYVSYYKERYPHDRSECGLRKKVLSAYKSRTYKEKATGYEDIQNGLSTTFTHFSEFSSRTDPFKDR